MPVKEMAAVFEGHQIVVRNIWEFDRTLTGSVDTAMTLSIDGKVVAWTSRRFSVTGRTPFLRGTVQTGDRSHIVEVFCRALVRTRIKICVDGQKVAGDLQQIALPLSLFLASGPIK